MRVVCHRGVTGPNVRCYTVVVKRDFRDAGEREVYVSLDDVLRALRSVFGDPDEDEWDGT